MGGLGHYFERDGVATTQISLIREHTAKMRPPRALWVPFELGRPLGVPDDAGFQRRVVLAALKLLEADAGPVLADYPEDAPPADETTGWACPVSFPAPPAEEITDAAPFQLALEREVVELAPWYDLAVERRGSSRVGSSGIEIRDIPAFITAFLAGTPPDNPRPDVLLADMLVFACDDLKAYYIEAATAQPGRASSAELDNWLWHGTTLGTVLITLRRHCAESSDPRMQDQISRFAPDNIVEQFE